MIAMITFCIVTIVLVIRITVRVVRGLNSHLEFQAVEAQGEEGRTALKGSGLLE